MPGQKKRKQKRQQEGRERAARFAPEAGRWEVLIETQDASDLRVRARRLRAGNRRIDWSAVRLDTLCGRLTHPTTYRLSLFVPTAAPTPRTVSVARQRRSGPSSPA